MPLLRLWLILIPLAFNRSRQLLSVLSFFLAAATATACVVLPPNQLSSAGISTSRKAADESLDLQFKDEAGTTRRLAEFRGKALLVNLWASWCGPCRKEMPALDRLQAKLGGSDFEVLALSADRGGSAAAKRFFTEMGINDLRVYTVDTSALRGGIRIYGLPTSLLLDATGREVERVVGLAEWDSADRIASIRSKLGIDENLAPDRRQ